ncbi:MAG: hypothetical protein IPK95_11375 [Cellvibrionales bacterium]|nr:hypothetical protein [Cellvibrionales bacterium]
MNKKSTASILGQLTASDAQQTDWQCEQGPFKAKRFKTLPPSHWTLLVQSVDQWIPEIQALLAQFDFLPRWRLDDIMISYATDGGGVGPHFDYYDVFLLQASGKRRWQVGQRCDENSALRDNDKIKLLKDFHTEADYTLATGDMLYLPAGVAHWGTAVGDDCITISIGFPRRIAQGNRAGSAGKYCRNLTGQFTLSRYKNFYRQRPVLHQQQRSG